MVDNNTLVFIVGNEIEILVMNTNSSCFCNDCSDVGEQRQSGFCAAVLGYRVVVATVDVNVLRVQPLQQFSKRQKLRAFRISSVKDITIDYNRVGRFPVDQTGKSLYLLTKYPGG